LHAKIGADQGIPFVSFGRAPIEARKNLRKDFQSLFEKDWPEILPPCGRQDDTGEKQTDAITGKFRSNAAMTTHNAGGLA
jgi:hypothetical protein